MDAALEAANALVSELGGRARWEATRSMFTRFLLAGDFEAARRAADEGLREAHGSAMDRASYDNQRVILELARGRFDVLLRPLRARLDREPSDALACCCLTMALSQKGGLDAAQALLSRLVPGERSAQRMPRSSATLFLLACVASAAAEISDPDRCRWLYQAMAPYERRMITIGSNNGTLGPVALYLGELSAGMGEIERARSHFAVAREIASAMRARGFAATIDAHDARLLTRSGDADAREEARGLAAAARAVAERLGMPRVLELLEAAAR
jgi:hypothetical protein